MIDQNSYFDVVMEIRVYLTTFLKISTSSNTFSAFVPLKMIFIMFQLIIFLIRIVINVFNRQRKSSENHVSTFLLLKSQKSRAFGADKYQNVKIIKLKNRKRHRIWTNQKIDIFQFSNFFCDRYRFSTTLVPLQYIPTLKKQKLSSKAQKLVTVMVMVMMVTVMMVMTVTVTVMVTVMQACYTIF